MSNPFETVPTETSIHNTPAEDLTTAELESEMYEAARQIVGDDPMFEPALARLLGHVGLDYPRGSGDYHGGKPWDDMSVEEIVQGMVYVELFYAVFGQASS